MRASLYLASSFEAAWQHVLLPWFETAAPRAFEQRAPVAVVTPFRSQAYLLRSKLLARGISLLGIKFLSAAQLRERLLRGCGLDIPLREHLRLLLAIAAEPNSHLFTKPIALLQQVRSNCGRVSLTCSWSVLTARIGRFGRCCMRP